MEKLSAEIPVAVVAEQPDQDHQNPPPYAPNTNNHVATAQITGSTGEKQLRVLVAADDTVPPKVLWQKENRTYTDVVWGVAYVLSFIAFLSTGFVLVADSKPRYEHDGETGNKIVSSHFRSDVQACCQGKSDQDKSSTFDLCDQLEGSNGRRLRAGDSKFDGDEGIFDAFLEAPEIIVGLLALAVFVAIIWVVMLRFFSKPIVILTEVVKVAVFIYMGIVQEETGTRVFCFFVAAGLIAYDIWARKEILFAAKILEHSTKAFKANPMMFVGCIFIKLFYVLNAFLFVLFFSKAYNVVKVQTVTTCFQLQGEEECTSQCVFVYPSYVGGISTFLGLAYLWSIVLFSKMRLSVIATMVGSWHFHPEDKPGVVRSVINSVTTSIGTLAVSSLIATVAERINRKLQEPCWRSWIGPAACVTVPLQLFLCCFGQCLATLVRMLTKFAVILHVFTGLPFLGSAKKVFKILSRHFKGGFVTEVTSKGVLNLGAYVFSIGIALLAWAWLDDRFDCSTLPGGRDAAYVIAWILLGLFNLWYPVLGIYLIIVVNRFLRSLEWTDEDGEKVHFQHLWLNPLAAIFVGCISMMFLLYVAAIFLDTVDVLFLCFAIDKDNNVDMSNDEFQSLIQTMPGYVEVIDTEARKMDDSNNDTFEDENGAKVTLTDQEQV